MRRNVLSAIGLWLLFTCALAACRTPPPLEEPATASRRDVTLALYRQLELVLDRHERLGAQDSAAARAEQDELVRLAAEIAVRIVRVDPRADLDNLVFRMGSFE